MAGVNRQCDKTGGLLRIGVGTDRIAAKTPSFTINRRQPSLHRCRGGENLAFPLNCLARRGPFSGARFVRCRPIPFSFRLNQIEIVFGMIMRKVIRGGDFTSVADLKDKLVQFIAYFNEVCAKLFRWTFTGRPLQTGGWRSPANEARWSVPINDLLYLVLDLLPLPR
jgi:hypothetical protein